MTHTQKKKIDRRAAGMPEDVRTKLPSWDEVRLTGKPGDRGVTKSGLTRTVPKPFVKPAEPTEIVKKPGGEAF